MNELPTQLHLVVEKVVQSCLARLDDPGLDLAALAREAGYSPFHFHRIFAAMTGEGPVALVRRLRLERAALCLVDTTASVGVIALAAGYSTPDSFARAFRQAFGVLPSQFRSRRFDYRVHSPNRIHFGHPVQIKFQTFGGISMQTAVENRPNYHVIGKAHRGPYWTIGRTFQEIAQWAQSNQVAYVSSLAVYYDDPERVPPEELRSEAMLVVDQPVSAPDGMIAYTIPAGKFLVTTHVGSYEGLGEAWKQFWGDELPKSGAVAREAPPFEHYLDDCGKVPQDRLRTELLIPIA